MIVDHTNPRSVGHLVQLALLPQIRAGGIDTSAGLLLERDRAALGVCDEIAEHLGGLLSERGGDVGSIGRTLNPLDAGVEAAYPDDPDALGNFTTLLRRPRGRFLRLEEQVTL